MSYNKRIWANGDLITKERMNNIENGIYDAHDKINVINNKVEENTTDTNTARQDISDIKLQIGTEELTTTSKKIKGAINALSLQINNLQNQINNLVLGAVGDGNNAEVIQARGKFNLLNERLDSIEGRIVPIDQPVRMTLGGSNHPYVDEANKRIVFPANPSDTVVYYGSNKITEVFPWGQESYIDLSEIDDLNTSLGIILMNITTKKFSLVRYDFDKETYKNTHIIIGTVRAFENELTVTLPVPFFKNGYLYGQEVKIPVIDLPVRMTLGGSNYPYLDETNKKIVFPANPFDTVVYYGENELIEVFPSEESYIDLSAVYDLETSASVILLDVSTKVFSIVAHDFNMEDYENTHIIFGTIRRTNDELTVTLPVPFFKNGYLYGQKTEVPIIERPVHMTLGGTNYPYVDEANKRIVFPANTLDTVVYYGENELIEVFPKEESYIDLSAVYDLETSASVILLDVSTKVFSIVAHDFNMEDYENTHIIFGTIRRTNDELAVTLPVPFFKNGYLYGQKTEKTKITLDENIKSVAHRGYSQEAPENTLPAYKLAKQKGFSYAECDVEWTADNVPVLLHDDSIDRTSNGTGNIHSLTLEQVKQYDFGSWQDPKYAGTTIPTLEEFILYCKKINIHPYIELKDSIEVTEEKVNILIDILKKYKMLDKCTWISFSVYALRAIKSHLPSARLGYLVDFLNEDTLANAQSLKSNINDVFIDMPYTDVETCINYVNTAIESGIEVEVWTVNDENAIDDLVEKNISGITTDYINLSELFLS